MSGWQFNVSNSKPPGKSAGVAGTIFLFLFGTPFAAGGIFAWVQAVKEFNAGKTKEAAMLLLFGLVFCGVGFGLMIGSIWAGQKARQDARRQSADPGQPWLWRKDWAAGRVKSTGKGAAIFLWVFAVFWNGISSFVFFMLPQELHKGNHRAWIALLFPAVGVGLLFAAVRSTLVQRRFGDCWFELAQIPAPLGGSLDGMIQTERPLRLEQGLHLKLSCLRRTVTSSGDEQHVSENIVWQSEKVFRPDAGLPTTGAGGSGIPVHFGLPADQPEATLRGASTIVWRLETKAKMHGPDFSATFEVPVFKVAGFVAPKSIEPDPTAALQMPVEEIRRDENSKIKITDVPGGREFYFPSARNPGAAFSLTIALLAFGGFTVAARRLFHSLFFEIAFGLVSLLVFIGCVNLWFKSSRVTIDSSGVRAVNRWLTFSHSRNFSAGDIGGVETKISMTSGNKALHCLQLGLRANKKFTVAGGIASKPEADWLVQEMTRALGRKI